MLSYDIRFKNHIKLRRSDEEEGKRKKSRRKLNTS